jgi:hypothetical protein
MSANENYMDNLTGRLTISDEGWQKMWQPIETAPRDGTAILAFERDPLGGMQVVTWERGRWLALYEYEQEPAYWMPLPTPPTP